MKRRVQLDRRPCTDFARLPSSSSSTASAMLEQAMDQVEVLRRFESTTYQRRDYLNSPDSPYTTCTVSNSSSIQQQQYYHHPAINETTRQAMVDLLYDVGDYCQFRRDTIAYAVWNLMDRYLSSPKHAPLQTVADFQLVACTALHIAVKVLEPVSMDVQSLADLSHGAFQGKDIVRMEQTMLLTLEWNIAHGPTPIHFVQLYLTILHQLQRQKGDSSSCASNALFDILLDHAQYQVELAVMDYKVAIHKLPSDIALAAVWNALQCHLACDEDEDMTTLQQWQHQLVQQLAKRPEPSHAVSFLDRLHKLPHIQLRLCKIQYTAELSCRLRAQEEQQQQQQEQLQLESSSTQHQPQLPAEVDVNDCQDAVCDNKTTTTEVTEMDEGSENHDDAVLLGVVHQESKVFPSPVSVTTNHMSADYNNNGTVKVESQTTATSSSSKVEHTTQDNEKSALYGFGFLRRLFFS